MAPRKKGPFSGHHIHPKQTEKPFAIYFIVKRVYSDNATFESVSPFIVEKALSSSVGEVANVRKLTTGDLFVEVASRQQSQKILKLKTFGTIPFSVSPHKSLNSSKGVITCGELLNEPLDVIEKELKSQRATHVRRITIRRDGKLLETKHHVLTFNSPKLPDSIKAGYMKLVVRPYVPNSLRCFKCQCFGHSKTNCRGILTCARCAAAGHEGNECLQKEKCINCKGDHTSFSRVCPKWKLEKEIISVKFAQNISFPEDRRLVKAQTPKEGKSYATAAKLSLTASGTQTKPVVILTTDTESDHISSSPIKEQTSSKSKKKKLASTSQKSLALKFARRGSSVEDLKSIKSVALELGKTGLAGKDLSTLFNNPTTGTELLKIHPSEEDDDDLHINCEPPATLPTGADNSSPLIP
ncbi:uncharacterized protein LOC129975564 [Argiope bruennichi]|uniref:uncharacterized protein LOC129975564 n=1 Tax=Argiope bruennichi TaxID=94029 RepID=UPI002495A490|nr:uncharacterized protein LOC129975564 [Argiope bruennichi]